MKGQQTKIQRDKPQQINNQQISRTLQMSPFFRGLSPQELKSCLSAGAAREREYKKGSFILRAGETTAEMGVVLAGSVTIESCDMWGNLTILSHVDPGQVFGETYAYLQKEILPVDAVANQDCRVLLINIGLTLERGKGHSWREKMLQNLLAASFQKNLVLSSRSFHTASKSCRGRLLSYLSQEALKGGTREFDIPFNRQQLADYLNLERTNMSKELSKMQKEGLIEFRKNHFVICREDI